MAYPIASGQLVHPRMPKVKDIDTDRALRELQAKLAEAQDVIRALAARVP